MDEIYKSTIKSFLARVYNGNLKNTKETAKYYKKIIQEEIEFTNFEGMHISATVIEEILRE